MSIESKPAANSSSSATPSTAPSNHKGDTLDWRAPAAMRGAQRPRRPARDISKPAHASQTRRRRVEPGTKELYLSDLSGDEPAKPLRERSAATKAADAALIAREFTLLADPDIDAPPPKAEAPAIDEDAKLRASGRATSRDRALARGIGGAAKGSFREVLGEDWGGSGVHPHERAVQAAVEAQIAAASLGHKPLYYDPWASELSEAVAASLSAKLPAGAEAHATEAGLLVFRPEAIRPILDADSAFYRPHGEDDLSAIVRVSLDGNNGELLGYGARNWSEPQGARVTITTPDAIIYMWFVSQPELATRFAAERAADIEAYTGIAPKVVIEFP